MPPLSPAPCVVAAALVLALPAHADDTYYRLPLSRAATPDNPIPQDPWSAGPDWFRASLLRPYAAVETGEAYVAIADDSTMNDWWMSTWSPAAASITVRAPAGAAVKGTLFVPDAGWTRLVAHPFTIDPATDDKDEGAREAFLRARLAHDERLRAQGVPGTAYFRWRADLTRRELGLTDRDAQRDAPAPELSDTYDLFSGGTAVSENLQLHRQLPPAQGATPAPPAGQPESPDEMIKLSTIPGITVAEFDWKAKLGPASPALGALSAFIPADQHAVFFPSFSALQTALDHAGDEGLPLARFAGPRSEDGMVAQRYERQLCLSRSAVSRLLGPQVIRSVAITGSDPYFPTGTDVAVIFHAVKADGLRQLLLAQVNAGAQAAGAKAASGNVEGIAYEGALTEDRSVCSYVAALGDAVVVTNSLAQLKALARVKAGASPSLATLPEFKYFRTRYLTTNPDETAFIFLSDPTIRRWCGPEWRIAASRRLRAAAIMADVTAAHAEELARGVPAPRPVAAETPMRTIGTLTLDRNGVRSSVYGSTRFMTPIRELALAEVPRDEADSYARWRDGYQRNWSWAFDPIAISLSLSREKLGADMTVMPLIGNSDYRRWAGIAQGAAIAPDAGDPHDTIAHAIVAINAQSPTVQQYTGMARMMAPQIDIEPLGWLGQSVAVYADPDPFWQELAAADKPADFFEHNARRLPVALHAEVGSALKLTAFLAAARAFIDQSSPGMIAWEPRTYNDRPYVKVGLSPSARQESRGSGFDDISVYYAPTPRALVLTLNEDLLKRALDRQGAATPKAPESSPAPRTPWMGSSLCLRATGQGLDLLRRSGREALRSQAQRRAWSNLPALNEWHRLFPDKDPVAVHEALWGARPVCPAGGTYTWNAEYSTMESSVYGHPANPRPGPDLPGFLDSLDAADFGLTFEDGGLRARALINRHAK